MLGKGENGDKDIPHNRIYYDKKNDVCFQAGHRRVFVHVCRGQCERTSSSDIPGSGQNGGVGAEGCSPGPASSTASAPVLTKIPVAPVSRHHSGLSDWEAEKHNEWFNLKQLVLS